MFSVKTVHIIYFTSNIEVLFYQKKYIYFRMLYKNIN